MEDVKTKVDFKTKVENLTGSVGDYLDSYYKLAVLKTAKKSTDILAATLGVFAIIFLGLFVLFFSGIALGLWLGELLDNVVAGYLIVAGIYLLALAILLMLRKSIVFPVIRNLIIRKLYE